jgi:hypothetical protein
MKNNGAQILDKHPAATILLSNLLSNSGLSTSFYWTEDLRGAEDSRDFEEIKTSSWDRKAATSLPRTGCTDVKPNPADGTILANSIGEGQIYLSI